MKNPIPIEKPSREDELLKQGWTKRFSASGSRLQETTELYQSMGSEVHLEPARAEDFSCPECHPQQPPATIEGFFVVYTRPRRGAVDADTKDKDLW